MSENGQPQPEVQQHTVDVKFDINQNTVTVTLKSINGVAVIGQTPVVISVVQWIEIAATLILAGKQRREAAKTMNRIKPL